MYTCTIPLSPLDVSSQALPLLRLMPRLFLLLRRHRDSLGQAEARLKPVTSTRELL